MEAYQYDTPDPEFVKGFNEGYTLARHLPELAAQLREATKENERGNGFKAGQQQLLIEREREREPAWLRGDLTGPVKESPSKEKNAPARDIDLDIDR